MSNDEQNKQKKCNLQYHNVYDYDVVKTANISIFAYIKAENCYGHNAMKDWLKCIHFLAINDNSTFFIDWIS